MHERFAILEHSPLPSWADRLEPFRVVWANQAAIDLWGARDLEELVARDHSETPEATKTLRLRWVEELRSGCRHIEHEWTIYPGGVPRHVTLFVTLMNYADGGAGFLFQVVERPETTTPEVMRQAEAMRHSGAILAMVTATGEIISHNPAADRAFGVNAPLERWFEEPQVAQDILDVAHYGGVHRASARSRALGERRDYALEARLSTDPVSGEEVILVHLLDETAQRGAERESESKARRISELSTALATVEAQEQRWRALVDSAPDLILIVDCRGQIILANHGLTVDLIHPSLEAVFAPHDRAHADSMLAEVFATGEARECRAELSTSLGSAVHNLRFGPIRFEGVVESVVVISRDVTTQRELEGQLRHAQKMQAVGTLAGGVAHDFNNLLMIIAGARDLAELELEEEHPTRELLDEIGSAADRAAALTRQLLVFSRRQELEPQPLELNGLVREMSKLLRRVITADIQLRLELCEGSCWTYADPGQLEQVLMNLVVNARDAMPEGGQLTITTAAEDDGSAAPQLLLAVEDTGEGMSPEVQGRIFEPFFTTKARGKGTGLGMSMVHAIVEQTGGTLGLTSEWGRGTRFEIRLPQRSKPQALVAGEDALEMIAGDELVLLVDDQPAVRRITAALLEALGYRVLLADSLGGALDHVRAQPELALMITDVVMPGASGPDIRDAVRELAPGLGVLFISGYTDAGHGRLGEGPNEALLLKPFSRGVLGAELRELLDSRLDSQQVARRTSQKAQPLPR